MRSRQSNKGGDDRRMELGGLSGETSKALGPRAILVNVLPAGLLTLLTVLLIGSGAPGDPSLKDLMKTLNGLQNGASLALLVIVVLVATIILQPLQIAVVQVLEGYWAATPDRRARSAVARKAVAIGVELQRRRLSWLQASDMADLHPLEQARLEEELKSYPDPSMLMPTRLGNVLKAGEQRAGGRYGLDADISFPHLYPLLRQPHQAAWDDLSNQLDSAAHLFLTFVLATLLSAILLIPHGWDGWWLALPLLFAGLAWLSYRSTIVAARYQTRLLAAAFDLHRFDLLTAMRMRLPNDPHEEFEVNRQLMAILKADPDTRSEQIEDGDERLEPSEGYVHPEMMAAPAPPEQEMAGKAVLWEWSALLGGDGNGEKVKR
jgi:hypothetical protein